MARNLQSPAKRKLGVMVSLDQETLSKLDAFALEVGFTRSRLLREMIDEMLERRDEKRWLAESAAAELAEDDVPWEEVKQELGL
ncbi:MAG: ribbon-helix-helix domain-containing protein [Armatimonadetes bacterium]|nr:ribbon-helix-helix domain-containing protein [Armatimonadota bacterium]